MGQETKERFALRIERTIGAARPRVFEAFTQTQDLREWYAPEGMIVAESTADARVGGRWSVVMVDPAGESRYRAEGEYREVTPPERLVFTHYWVNDDEAPVETLITVEFHEEGSATRVVMVHEGFLTAESRTGHEEGWGSCFNRLERLFA